MAEKKFDFSKIKEIGNMDLKDVKKLFANSNNSGSESKIKKILNTKIERPKNVISFDIGTNSIKMVTGKYSKGKISINKCIDVPTPEGVILDGKITNEDTLKDILQFAFKENGIKAKDAICTTNSSLIINRDITIPKVQKEEMDTVIRYEIQQYLPINLADYILQFTVVDEIIGDEGGRLKVNVIAYPEKIASSYYRLFNSLELNPYVLDVSYNSLNKISNYAELNNSDENVGGTVAFIDMGATTTNVTIFKSGKLDFTRMIKTGGDNIDFSLSQKLNMSVKSTESIKIDKGNLNDIKDEDEINLTIKRVIDNKLEDLERIIQFYKNKSVGNEINKIYIYGGTSNIKGLSNYIEDRFTISTEKITELKNIDFTSKELKEQSMEQYLNAIGAIIRL